MFCIHNNKTDAQMQKHKQERQKATRKGGHLQIKQRDFHQTEPFGREKKILKNLEVQLQPVENSTLYFIYITKRILHGLHVSTYNLK